MKKANNYGNGNSKNDYRGSLSEDEPTLGNLFNSKLVNS